MFDITQGACGALIGAYATVALTFQYSTKEKDHDLQQAAFLIGLSKFVDEKCPSLRTNRSVLYSAITRVEIDIRETKTDDFKARVDGVMEKLEKKEKSPCELARRNYGPSGTITPRIFSPR